MAPMIGFWGPPTASVDWCEENYLISHYIAEFYNSLSSLAILFVGEYCAYRFNSTWSAVNFMFRAISVVGIGSVLFHATLLQPMQMLDEIPMLWSAITMLYILCTARYNIKTVYFKLLLIAIGLGTSFSAAFYGGNIQFIIFQLTFLTMESITCVQIYLCTQDTKTSLKKLSDPAISRLYVTGLKYYLAGVFIWLTDTFLCKFINNTASSLHNTSILPFYPQLHAFWHFFASLGVLNFATFVYCYHLLKAGKSVKLNKYGLLLYTVSATDPKSH
ncbi:hypothetical protein BB561_000974 [Smittium simulii]|uniref:Alkaline ceramidase n=1 Tax=Smittium simulii TaxID=133385 RepID=A0A2T9YWQ6_9FUNG|nr:hypothetical protein BB561_000974 [Smittium simulii]